MIREYKKVIFEDETLRPGAIVRDARFVQCSFISCGTNPADFSLVERVTLERTTLKSKRVGGVICRDVTIDTCKNSATFIASNCLLDKVTMVGRFGSWMFLRSPEYLSPEQAAYAATFYDSVEWALDIRRAEFKDLTLRGVPGDKVCRDPARHVLLRKDRLLADRSWEKFEVGLAEVLRASVARPEESEILAAGDLPKPSASELAELNLLRDAGFAE